MYRRCAVIVLALLVVASRAQAQTTPPTIRATGTVSTGQGNCTPGLPTGTAVGDLLLMWCETQAGQAAAATGWTNLETQSTGTPGSRLTALYRVATGSGDAPTVTDPGDHCLCRITGITVGTWDTVTPFNVESGGVHTPATNPRSLPAITATADYCRMFTALSGEPDCSGSTCNASFCTVIANASCINDAEIIDNRTASGDGGGMCVQSCTRAGLGTFDATAITTQVASIGGEHSVAVCKLPPPTPPTEFFTGFEFGQTPYGDLGKYIFDAPTTAAAACTIAATPSSHDTDDDFALSCSLGTSTGAAPALLMTQFQASGQGCFVSAVRDTPTTYHLVVRHRSLGRECQAGYNDGVDCTGDEVCVSQTPGESGCRDAIFATSDSLTASTWHDIALIESHTGYDVACELWVDALAVCAASRPEGICQVSVGVNADYGGYAWACGDNADCNTACGLVGSPACCPSSCLCGANGIQDLTGSRLGDLSLGKYLDVSTTYISATPTMTTGFKLYVDTIGNSSTPWHAYYDDWAVDDSQNPNLAAVRVQDVVPNGDTTDGWGGAQTGCASETQCVDEANGTIDLTDRTATSTTANADAVDVMTLGNITIGGNDTSNGGEGVIMGVATSAIMRDTATAAGVSQLCRTNITGFTATAGNTVATESQWVPCGYTRLYSAAMDTMTEFNAASIDMHGDKLLCGSSCQMDATQLSAEVLLQQDRSEPAITALPNTNGDASVGATVVVGDSTVNDLDNSLCSKFPSITDLRACTQGTTNLADFLDNLDSILDGSLGGRMGCEVVRGAPIAPDVVLMSGGVNTFAAHRDVLPVMDSAGYCRGGANDGNGAWCPRKTNMLSDINETECYCMNHTAAGGTRYLAAPTTCTSANALACSACSTSMDCGAGVACSTNADCFFGFAQCSGLLCTDTGAVCATNADCTHCESGECRAPCTGGQCQSTIGVYQTLTTPASWIAEGCPDTTDCPDGLIIGTTPTAEAKAEWLDIVNTITSRTGSEAATLVWMTQPHGTAADNITGYSFNTHRPRIAHFDAWAKNYCEEHGIPWIDLDRYFRVACLNRDERQCYRDAIHWSLYPYSETGCDYCTSGGDCSTSCAAVTGCGQGNACTGGAFAPSFTAYDPQDSGIDHAIDLINACFNNDPGARDGVCTALVCTGGAIGDACVADTDCDLYHCDFGS